MKNFIIFLFSIAVAACNTTKNSTAKKEDEKKQATFVESMQQKQAEGIDLFARGSVPSSWTLEIDFDKIIRFRSLDGADYKSTAVNPVYTGNNTATFTTRAGMGNMVITLLNDGCTDALSGDKFNKKVTVDVDGKRYEGCGQYLVNETLNGKWILEKVSSIAVLAADFSKGLPELSFDLSGGSISGHDGCNHVNGSIEVQGSRIKFSALAGTKMACPGNKKENEFLHKLSSQVVTYYFSNGQLVLYLNDDSTIAFKKN
ncbi:MAG: META domain-containing protein [Rhizobacter sp.]|nr:META domain-containing protein [Ferruginibacter sp.]